MATSEELIRVTRERDLYARLLRLGREGAVVPLLREALVLIVDTCGATNGYIELRDDDDPAGSPRWWLAHGFSEAEVEGVRAALSRGIIAEALATGQTIATASAAVDERFREQASVRRRGIEAVLCAPIGDDPPRGVLYFQGRTHPGPFSDEDRTRVETVASFLGPFADRLLADERQRRTTDPTQPWRDKLRLDGVIGSSTALADVLKQAALVAPLDVSVLITGESGTGKSQLARIIHDNSPRSGKPFVDLNCAALPEGLVESELFGALPGAHSTATRRIDGKVAAAAHGTLFLDEIGELPGPAQAKLLHLLQSKQYYALGGTNLETADVRVIAATNSDLQAAVAARHFREDLFYRLQVLPIRMPSLAERRDDLAALAEFFCSTACRRHHLPRLTLTRGALRALESAEWPGNVRQLANAIEAATIRAAGDGAQQVERSHVFPASAPEGDAPVLTLQEATRRFQTALLQQTLRDSGWNVSEAARRLDLTRTHVHHLIRAFGLERTPSK